MREHCDVAAKPPPSGSFARAKSAADFDLASRQGCERRRRSESLTTFTQRSTRPTVAPTTTTAIGVTNAICSSEYFVTAAPTSQMTRTTTIMTAHRTREPTSESLDTLGSVLAANYRSGDDFVVEFLGHRFEFNAEDFEERVIGAAVRLGLIGSNDLDEDEAADLVELAADGRIADPRSGLGLYLVRHWERIALVDGESLVYWLRKLVFRGAWLDHRVKEGLLDVSWIENTGDFGYAEPEGGRTLLELAPVPSWRELQYRG